MADDQSMSSAATGPVRIRTGLTRSDPGPGCVVGRPIRMGEIRSRISLQSHDIGNIVDDMQEFSSTSSATSSTRSSAHIRTSRRIRLRRRSGLLCPAAATAAGNHSGDDDASPLPAGCVDGVAFHHFSRAPLDFIPTPEEKCAIRAHYYELVVSSKVWHLGFSCVEEGSAEEGGIRAKVEAVKPNSWALRHGIREGDELCFVDGQSYSRELVVSRLRNGKAFRVKLRRDVVEGF